MLNVYAIKTVAQNWYRSYCISALCCKPEEYMSCIDMTFFRGTDGIKSITDEDIEAPHNLVFDGVVCWGDSWLRSKVIRTDVDYQRSL